MMNIRSPTVIFFCWLWWIFLPQGRILIKLEQDFFFPLYNVAITQWCVSNTLRPCGYRYSTSGFDTQGEWGLCVNSEARGVCQSVITNLMLSLISVPLSCVDTFCALKNTSHCSIWAIYTLFPACVLRCISVMRKSRPCCVCVCACVCESCCILQWGPLCAPCWVTQHIKKVTHVLKSTVVLQ